MFAFALSYCPFFIFLSMFTEPFEKVGNIKGKSNGRNLVLSWETLPLDKHGGFLLGYKVTIFYYDSNTTKEPSETKSEFSS